MVRLRLPLLLLLVCSLSAFADDDGPLLVEVSPDPVYVSRAGSGQAVNFDLVVTNRSDAPVTLREIKISALDSKGKLQVRKFVNDNGAAPSIDVIGSRTVQPKERRLIFNPLFAFDDAVELATLELEITYRGDDRRHFVVKKVVRPLQYRSSRSLLLPVRGKLLIWDGYDFYSHHRRFDYVMPMIHEFGFRSNSGRYAYDIVPVNESGEMFRGDEDVNESWFGFGTPIYAAAAGTVVAARDDRADDRRMDMSKLKADHLEMFGNYVVIRHAPGEFAVYGHIRQGSARCKVGDAVKQGQEIAAMGTSGSSIFPHLHFQLQTTGDADGEGLPSTFERFYRLLGSRRVPVRRGAIDSGDIVESR